MKSKLSKLIVITAVALGAIGGCGGDDCNFNLSGIYNGFSSEEAISQWNCVASRQGQSLPQFVIQFFSDDTGFNSAAGEIVFERTGCRGIMYESETDSAQIMNLQGSVLSGILIFDQVSTIPDQDGIQAACTPEFF